MKGREVVFLAEFEFLFDEAEEVGREAFGSVRVLCEFLNQRLASGNSGGQAAAG